MKKEITIKWNSVDHVIPVTMALINRIENADVNLLKMARELSSGELPKFSLIATMYAIMLRSVGETVTDEQVWEAITRNKAIEIGRYANAALNAFFPDVEQEVDEEEEVKKEES